MKICQRPVIESTTHTETVSIRVEGHEWHQYQIQSPCRQQSMFHRIRLWNAKTIRVECLTFTVFAKPERLSGWRL